MSTILVPAYLDGQTQDAPPGHRFQLYLGGWGKNKEGKYDLSVKDALPPVCAMGAAAVECARELAQRQLAMAVAGGDSVLARAAITTSAFVTGVGMEHPSENGFAFLSPYGVPYLPGSGIKGVVRRAAEELALGMVEGGCWGWDLLRLWRLFGFEGDSGYLGERSDVPAEAMRAVAEKLAASDTALVAGLRKAAQAPAELTDGEFLYLLATSDPSDWRARLQWRGALQFWDGFIQPAEGKLVVEILTPHHKAYYEAKNKTSPTPADCESPTPVCFLAVPPGSGIRFYVGCERKRLSLELDQQNQWKELVNAALDHAFRQVGFGAKTAAGYGALETDSKGESEIGRARGARDAEDKRVRLEAEKEAQRARKSPLDRDFDDIAAAAPGVPRLTALFKALTAGRWQGETVKAAAEQLSQEMIAAKTWRDQPTGKKPDKDWDYQRTLAVKRLLEGKP